MILIDGAQDILLPLTQVEVIFAVFLFFFSLSLMDFNQWPKVESVCYASLGSFRLLFHGRLYIGDCFAWHGPSSHSERPVGSEVQHIGPMPADRFFCGESGLHCT